MGTELQQLLVLTAPMGKRERDAFMRALRKRGVEVYAAFRLHVDSPTRLTPRQKQVLRWIAMGLKGPQIAMKLGISVKTVDTYRQQLMDRLRTRSVPELVRYAIRQGMLPVSWLFE